MNRGRSIKHILYAILCTILLLAIVQCGGKAAESNTNLPQDILGISVGMNKDDSRRYLKEIGKLIREDEKRQEVWVLKDNPTFGHLGIGYDRENRVQFVTAFAKPKDEQPMRYEQVGDLAVAKKESTETYFRYIWDVGADKVTGYSVIAQGNNADHLSMLTISKPDKGEEEEKEKREERK